MIFSIEKIGIPDLKKSSFDVRKSVNFNEFMINHLNNISKKYSIFEENIRIIKLRCPYKNCLKTYEKYTLLDHLKKHVIKYLMLVWNS